MIAIRISDQTILIKNRLSLTKLSLDLDANPQIQLIFHNNMDKLNNDTNHFMKYPPNSNPPKGLVNSGILKNHFLNEGAGMLPKLQDFNQMFRQYANSILNMNESVFPPGHPLFNRERSISALKETNDKLLKENLELKKRLEEKTTKK